MIRRYQQPESTRERDRLIKEHIPVAQRIARKVARRLPPGPSADDLVAAAMLGLTQAAERFDPARGEAFLPFAERRIRGAVYDELRRGDILPRRRRTAAKRARAAIQTLEGRLGREPTDEEVAKELGVDVATYREDVQTLMHVAVVGLERTAPGEPSLRAVEPNPMEYTERRETLRRLRSSLEEVPERDRILLSLYYLEDLTYAEIGKVLNVSESRVCQLHSRAIVRMRALMEPAEELKAA